MSAFPDVEKIVYEGPESKNPLAFRWYNEDEMVEGKTMKDHFRFIGGSQCKCCHRRKPVTDCDHGTDHDFMRCVLADN